MFVNVQPDFSHCLISSGKLQISALSSLKTIYVIVTYHLHITACEVSKFYFYLNTLLYIYKYVCGVCVCVCNYWYFTIN